MKRRKIILSGLAALLILAVWMNTIVLAQDEYRDYSRLVVGNTTHLSGDFFTDMWGNATSDLDVRRFLHGYNLVSWDFHAGIFQVNDTAVSGMVATQNSAGDHIYQIALYDDLLYCDGSPITAWDYAFSFLLEMAPQMEELGAKTSRLDYIQGAEAYRRGDADVLAGLKIISDYEFTLTIDHEYLPYFYELGLLSIQPYPITAIAPGCKVKDDGEGVYIANEDAAVQETLFTVDLLKETILDKETGYRSHPSVTSGPYMLKSFDGESAIFDVNPYFKGDAEGMKPTIPELEYTVAENADMIEKLEAGEFDLLNKVSNQEALKKGIALAGSSSGFSMSTYPRSGLSFAAFTDHSDIVKDELVRQAIALAADRAAITRGYEGSFGMPAEGYFGVGQWMYSLINGTMPYPVSDPGEDASEEETAEYEKQLQEWQALSLEGVQTWLTDDREKALEEAASMLEQAGWNLNESGESFNSETDSIRFRRDAEGNLTPLALTIGYPAGNAIGDLLEEYMAGPLAQTGVELTVQSLDFAEILSEFYGQSESTCDLLYLATNFDEIFDPSENFLIEQDEEPEWGSSGIRDQELYDLARDLRRTAPGDTYSYMKKWIAFQERFSRILPVIPIYTNVYFDFYTSTLQGYNPMQQLTWAEEILYAVYADVPKEPEEDIPAEEEMEIEGDEYLEFD